MPSDYYQRSVATHVVAAAQRGDIHLVGEIVSASHPYVRGRLVVDRGTLRYQRPRRDWSEYAPIPTVPPYVIPVPVIRCIERR